MESNDGYSMGNGEKFSHTFFFSVFMQNCVLWQAGGSTGLLMDLAANEKAVHSDFFNGKMFIYTEINILLK